MENNRRKQMSEINVQCIGYNCREKIRCSCLRLEITVPRENA